MFQSLTVGALSSVVADAVADPGDFSDEAMFGAIIFLSLVAVVAAVTFLVKAMAPVAASRAPKAPTAARVPATRVSRSTEPAPPPTRRRLIVLYDVTPGQTPYEYNLGDSAGTRGVSPSWNRAR